MHQIDSDNPNSNNHNEDIYLSANEEAARSYVGGYLIRALINKVNNRQLSCKANIVEALHKCHECFDDVTDEVNDESDIQDWKTLCNRGGLVFIRTEFQNFLISIEIVVKRG